MEHFVDAMNQFALEHKRDLSFYDIDSFKEAKAQLIGEGVAMAILPDTTKYCQFIDRAIDYANTVSMTPEELAEFYTRIAKSPYIGDEEILATVQPKDTISKIRPEYLSNVPMEFDKVVQDILKDSIKESEIRTNYIAGEYFNKLRRQLVKSSVPYNDAKDLMIVNDLESIRVGTFYIQSTVIPFLRAYNQNVKDLTTIAENAKGIIRNTHMDITNSMKALSELESSGKLNMKQARLISYFKYNMYRQYMNACAYVVTSIMRKMKYYVFNITAFINLYNTINSFFPEGEMVLHEFVKTLDELREVDDEVLLDCALHHKMDRLIPILRDAINWKKTQIANIVAKYSNTRLDYNDMDSAKKYPYDTQPYIQIHNCLTRIFNDLHEFEKNAKDPNMIVDDVLAKSNLDTPFLSQYSDTLSNIDSIENYKEQESFLDEKDTSLLMSVYTELASFERNLDIISGNLYKVYKYIHALSSKFETNIDELDDNTYNEYKSTLETVTKSFEDFALHVTKKMISRSDNLVTFLDDIMPDAHPSDPTPEMPNDYAISAYREAYDEICEAEKEVFESLMKDYYAERKRLDTGAKVIFEETKEAPDDTKGASVKTDAAAQHSDNNANNTTNNNTNANNKESIIKKFQDWFKQLLEKFRNKSARLVGTNNRWLASVKADIQNLDTSNTTINLAKYEGVASDTLASVIQSATNKINALNPSNLPADMKDRAKAEAYLFGAIPAKIGNETNFVARIKQFYTFGNTDKTNLISYSGDDAKSKIDDIISFCEGYDGTYKSVSNELDKLSKAAAKKQQDIINALGTQAQTTRTINTNESVMFEAPQTQNVTTGGNATGDDKENKEKITTSSMVTSITREFSGAVLTVLEKKYLDYIKVLSKLAPKKENEPKADNSNENSENNQEENQNNEG